VAEYLLAHGATPTLFAAVALGRADVVRALAAKDPALVRERRMSRFEHHRTALHLAVAKNRPAMVRLLLELGADPRIKDARGDTPLSLAKRDTEPAIADMLVAAGADAGDKTMNRFESAVPILNVKNVTASIAYYVDKLGFEKEWAYGDPPAFACVWRDRVRIFLCRDAQGGPGTWISIFVQDVDALYGDYRERGAIIRQEPTTFPWGVREMNVQDLDGHRLRIGSESSGPADDADLDESP
jgi:uncharacterized glyoxalase superfamily protein PhnB